MSRAGLDGKTRVVEVVARGKFGKVGQVPWIHTAGLGTPDRPLSGPSQTPQWARGSSAV